MSKHKHTPIPWEVRESNMGIIEIKSKNVPICDMDLGACDPIFPESEMRANAHLIAAAPDLLEACEKYRDLLRSSDMFQKLTEEEKHIANDICKAISKAKGD